MLASGRSAGEPALTQTPQTAQQGVVGAVVGIEHLAAGGLFDRCEHADPGALVASVGLWGSKSVHCGLDLW